MAVGQTAPRRRQLDFRTWSEVLYDVDHLRETGYVRAGNWDLSQILEHIGDGLKTARAGKSQQGSWLIRKLIGPLILKQILKQRRMKAGIKVPEWWLPGPAHDESAAADAFRAEVAAFEGLTTQPFPHPFFGPLSKQQWNELALIHASHHLSFLSPR
jgi:hypothetical protein